MEVASTDPLVMFACHNRPTLCGLNSAPSSDGKMPWLFCRLVSQLTRLFRFSRFPGVQVSFVSILCSVDSKLSRA